jgi:hypothetical protein
VFASRHHTHTHTHTHIYILSIRSYILLFPPLSGLVLVFCPRSLRCSTTITSLYRI